MALITCQECKKEISSTAKSCPNCGAKVPRAKVWPWIVGVPAALFVAFMIFGITLASTPEGKEKAQARDAISFCWQQQSDKALDPGTQRFVAATCEKMEHDFKDKYAVDP